MDQIQPEYKQFFIAGENNLHIINISVIDSLIQEIQKQWIENKPFILAICDNGNSNYNSYNVNRLSELNINPNITKIFFYILHLSKKGIVFDYYLGCSKSLDSNQRYLLNFSIQAANGNKEAIYKLGESYFLGEIVEKNLKIAKKLLKISALKHQNSEAFYDLAYLYKESPHLKNCFEEMKKWFFIAANNDYIDAQYEMGLIYSGASDLQEIPLEDANKAFLWFSQAAQNNCAYSQLKLSEFFEKGIVTKKNLEEAYYWIILAAANDNEIAQNYLEQIINTHPRKDLLANAYYRVLLTFQDTRALSKEYEKKQFLLNQAAIFGHSKAQLIIGECYYEKNDYSEAKKWFGEAKEQNEIAAFFYSVIEYFPYEQALVLLGRSLKEDKELAIDYLKKAADLGSVEAKYELGVHYCSSIDHKMHDLGLTYLKLAAEANYKDAANIISIHMPD